MGDRQVLAGDGHPPLLSSALNHSIDSILLPQELVVLSAIYTDGQQELDVTQLVNQFVASDRLSLIPGSTSFPTHGMTAA